MYLRCPGVLFSHFCPFYSCSLQDLSGPIEADRLAAETHERVNGRHLPVPRTQVAAVLLQLHIRRREDPDERGIVLVLGCTDWQRDLLRQELLRLMPELRDTPPGSCNPRRARVQLLVHMCAVMSPVWIAWSLTVSCIRGSTMRLKLLALPTIR